MTQAMQMVAACGEACTDMEALRAEPAWFGSVPSDSTLYRSFFEITPSVLAGLSEAVAEVRWEVWRRANLSGGGPVVLDIDATLVEIHRGPAVRTAPHGRQQRRHRLTAEIAHGTVVPSCGRLAHRARGRWLGGVP
jgi:hypothetical protein